MSNKPTSQPSGSKPRKPRKDFPLSIHKGTGYWCKKVRGRVHYFGKVEDDPKGAAALEEWESVKEDLYAGREPRAINGDELMVAGLCNQFLTLKEQLRDNGEITARTFRGYYDTCETVVKAFGRNRVVTDLRADDFRNLRVKLARTRGPVSLKNEITRVKSIFKFGFDDGLLITPVRYGQGFKPPSADTIRRERESHRAEHGDRMFEVHEIRTLLAAAKQPLRAMILLAVNGGLGQSDLANIPTRAINLETGMIDFARVKTAVPRRIPLWPDTISAIREWQENRPKAKEPADTHLVFLTVRGSRWVKVTGTNGAPKDAIGQEFNKLLRKHGLKRPKLGFYGLRRSFRTVADEVGDVPAIDRLMGHTDQSMAAHYRERISDERLRAVVDHVRAWLFADETEGGADNE